MDDFWGEPISVYSRAQAIEDGFLVDVSECAREAGFKVPVAVTRAVWDTYVEVPEGVRLQDEAGRLWDVLWMLSAQCRNSPSPTVFFHLHVRNDNREGTPPLVRLKAVVGPGDDPAPVITVLLPDES